MAQIILKNRRVASGLILFALTACGKQSMLVPPQADPSHGSVMSAGAAYRPSGAVFIARQTSGIARTPAQRPSRIPPGEYLYIVSQTTSIDGVKNAPGLEIAAVPVTARGVVKPTYTIEAKLGWVYTPGEVSYCFPAVANGIAISGSRIYVADGYATADPRRKICSRSHNNEIRVYSTKDQGEVKPQRVISGDHTFLFEPDYINDPTEPTGALAIGNGGSLYVGYLSHPTSHPPKLTTPSVLVFSPTAKGNVAPSRLIFLRIEDESEHIESAAVPYEAIAGKNDLGLYFLPNSELGCGGLATIPQDANGVTDPIMQFVPEESIPAGIAFDGNMLYAGMLGKLFSNNHFVPGGVAAYDATAPATPMPGFCELPAMRATRYIHGRETGLKNPLNVVTDNRGNLYVLSEEGPLNTVEIATFKADSNGNTRPIRYARVVLSNTAPGGSYPNRLAFGRVP